jgi:acetyl esterase/lipase
MRSRQLILVLVLGILNPTLAADSSQHSRILLWPDGAPQASGSEAIDQPALTFHPPPAGKSNGTAVIVNPGGGYRILASDHEGLQVARWLNRIGVTAFVLRYRVRPKYEPAVSLLDAQRAIRFVRYHAAKHGVSPRRIGMLGFSAGGHLTTAAGTHFDSGILEAADPIDRVSSRPDFIVPVYPVVSGEIFNRPEYAPTHTRVTARTPPTFLVQTHEDTTVSPLHPILFYKALLEHKVQAEMHIFGYGAHGLGLAPGDPDFNQWPELLARWLRRTGLLTDAERIAVSGSVTLDGEPVPHGWLTLLPEDPNAPIARALLNPRDGNKFTIPREQGPVPGRHRVELHRTSTVAARSNDGSYSMGDAERFSRLNPADASPIVVELAPGREISISVRSK